MKNGYDKLHARQIRKIQIADSLIPCVGASQPEGTIKIVQIGPMAQFEDIN